MKKTIKLQLDRGAFVLSSIHRSGEQLEVSARLSAVHTLGFACPETRCHLSVEDVALLIAYISSHIEDRRQARFMEQKEMPFVPGELGFRIHALSGVYGGSRLGYFSMSIMLNITDCAEGQPRLYAGLQSCVFVDDVLTWCDDLTSWIDEKESV